MKVRGTQQGSSLRMPAPVLMASWLSARFDIVWVVMAASIRSAKRYVYHRRGDLHPRLYEDPSCCAMENALQPTASTMSGSFYQGRRAVTIENQFLRVTVLIGGGHIAEVYEKSADINPLWTPPWKSMDALEFDRLQPADYGDGDDNKLLAAIMG